MDRGANVNAKDNQGNAPVCAAVQGGSTTCGDVVADLIGRGASPCTRCSGNVLLYEAAGLSSVRDVSTSCNAIRSQRWSWMEEDRST